MHMRLILIFAVITQLFVTPLAYSEVTAAQQADALRELRQWYDAERSRLHAAEGQSERWRQAQLIRDVLALSVRLADDYAEMDAVPAGGDVVLVDVVMSKLGSPLQHRGSEPDRSESARVAVASGGGVGRVFCTTEG